MADEFLHPRQLSQYIERVIRPLSQPQVEQLFQRLRAVLRWMTWGYVAFLLLGIVVVRWCGERNWITATLIYFPVGIGLLPLFLLTPLSILFYRRLCWIQLLVPVLLLLAYQYPHFATKGSGTGKTIRVVTNNVGQRKPGSMLPFVQAHDPDIVAFQECGRRERLLKQQYPDRFVAVQDEFALVSRWPIKHAGFVPGLFSYYGYAAAWFEVDCNGQSLIVYNVHMPTPRPDFVKMRGHGFLVELARGGGVYSSVKRQEYKDAMKARVEEGEKLAEYLAREKRPFVVLGDFNMPNVGYLYRVFSGVLTDVFAAKGNGYGLTFPGMTRNPLSLFGPWLRIDYIFVGSNFRPLNCEVEPWTDAQHLAVAAELEWQTQ